MFQKMKKPLGGRGQFLMPIMVKNPGAWTGLSEGGALPSNLNPDTTEASFSLTEFAGLYNMSWKLIQDARNSKFAFQTALKMMEAGFRRRILKLINADLLSDGLGKLATMPAADNQTTITVAELPSVSFRIRLPLAIRITLMACWGLLTMMIRQHRRVISGASTEARLATSSGSQRCWLMVARTVR